MNMFAKIIGTVIRTLRTPLKLWSAQQKLTALVACLGIVLAGLVTTTAVLEVRQNDPAPTEPHLQETDPPATQPPETTLPPTEDTTPTETEPVETTEPEEILPVITDKVYELQELYKQNSDLVGWIYVADTKIDEPVLYTPDSPDKYLYKSFEGYFRSSGSIYIDETCTVDPESQVLKIYGHNMINGTRFADLFKYQYQSFWEDHPYFYYTTLEGARTYQVISAGFDKIHSNDEDVFKFHKFINPTSKEEFDKGIQYFIENSEIDTGVTADYNDSLVMLITCSYHTENGRFVVLAKRVPYVEPEK